MDTTCVGIAPVDTMVVDIVVVGIEQADTVIHQNGTSPSECRLSLCRHAKGHLWIEVCLEYYSLAYYEIHFASIQLITLPHLPC